MNKADKLPPSTIFEDIPAEDVDKLCSRGRDVTFEAGHRLFERGEEADDIIILREGTVELVFPVQIMGVSRDLTLEAKQPGDVLAWSAMVDPHQLTLSARCATQCVMTRLSREVIREYFETRPEVGYLFMRNLAGVIGRRLLAMHNLWLGELQASAAKRLE